MPFADGGRAGGCAVPPPRTQSAGPPAAWVVLRRLEAVAMWAAAVVWLGCLLIIPFNLTWRRDIGHVALAAVLAAALLAWLNRTALPEAVARYAPRSFAAAALVALLLILLPRRRGPRRPDA